MGSWGLVQSMGQEFWPGEGRRGPSLPRSAPASSLGQHSGQEAGTSRVLFSLSCCLTSAPCHLQQPLSAPVFSMEKAGTGQLPPRRLLGLRGGYMRRGPLLLPLQCQGRTWVSILATERPRVTVDQLHPLSAGLLMSRACVFVLRNQPVCRQEWRVQPPVLLHAPHHQVRLPHRPGAAERHEDLHCPRGLPCVHQQSHHPQDLPGDQQ